MDKEEEEADDRTTVVGQRADLTDDEKDRLAQLLPVGPHVGVLFVTGLTTTNLRRYDMVSFYISAHHSY